MSSSCQQKYEEILLKLDDWYVMITYLYDAVLIY